MRNPATRLYFNPQSRAVIARWMLDECGASYEIVPIDLSKREHKTPEFLRINRAGKLPALVDGDVKVSENAAICIYLADKFTSAHLAPKIDAPERGRYLSLMVMRPRRSSRRWAMQSSRWKPRQGAAGPISKPSRTSSKASLAMDRTCSENGLPPPM